MNIKAGQRGTNKAGFKYTILYKTKTKRGRTGWLLRFDSGHEVVVERHIINKGDFRDNLSVTVCGVGTLGVLPWLQQERVLWKNMINRVMNLKSYKDCSISNSWLLLSNFTRDIRLMENYSDWLLGGYYLDKDLIKPGNTVYCKEFCSLLPYRVNRSIKKRDVIGCKKYLAVHKSGLRVVLTNQRDFAEVYKLCYKNLNRAIKKGGKVKGWLVEEIDV